MWGLLLFGCAAPGDPVGGMAYAEDYAGRTGVFLELGPAENPQNTPLILHIDEVNWVLKLGAEWADAESLAQYPFDLEDGLHVGENQLLPPRLAPGETGDGVEVTATGRAEVYYGAFDETATVQITSGIWAGEQIFARDLGPVRVTYQGQVRELAYYE